MLTFISRLWNAIQDRFDPLVYGPKPIIHITRVQPAGNYRLRLTFSTGETGEIDLSKHLSFIGTLAPLADIGFFRKVYIERGTINWPGGISMDSTVIHDLIPGLPAPSTPAGSSSRRQDKRRPAAV